MQVNDRKVAWGLVIALGVIGFALLWLCFVGPADHNPYYSAQCERDCDVPWWAASSFWMAFFTAILTASTGLLWIETRRLAKGAVRQEIKMAESIKEAKKSSERQLRAYVLVSSCRVVDPLNPATRHVELQIKNYGLTPAHDQTLWGGSVVREFPLQAPLTRPAIGLGQGVEVLPPGRTSDLALPVGPLNAWEEQELRAGRAGIYIHGEIRYVDAFGHDRVSEFRLVSQGEGFRSSRAAADTQGNRAT